MTTTPAKTPEQVREEQEKREILELLRTDPELRDQLREIAHSQPP